MNSRSGWLVCILFFFTLSIVCFSDTCSQTKEVAQPAIELYIQTVFDSINSNQAVMGKYLSGGRGRYLAALVGDQLKRVLETKFADIAVDVSMVIVEEDDTDLSEAGDNVYSLFDTIFVDDESSFNINTTIEHVASGTRVKTFNRVLKSDLLERYDWWSKLEMAGREPSAPQRIQQILYEIATSLVAVIENDIFTWIVESSIRIRVEVDRFTQIEGLEEYRYLEEALRHMVESELSRSEAIVVYAQDEVKDKGPMKPRVNYRIDGRFVAVGGQLRIDIRCIKEVSSRILVSCGTQVDAIHIEEISRKITDVSHRLKRAMEADFKQSTRTLAVIAKPPVRLFSFEKTVSEDITIAREIVRTITQKLRLLSTARKEYTSRLSLQVLDDPEKITYYINNPAEPADIISDLDVDYLAVVSYENLGNEIRLTTNLFSYDVERLAFAKFIHEAKGKKVDVNEAIDETVLALLGSLCRSKLLATGIVCNSLTKLGADEGIYERIGEVQITDIRKNKGLGVRLGVVSHNEPDLYIGKETTPYLEIFYTFMIPDLHHWGLDFAFEPSIGLDVVNVRFPLNGLIAANSFINFKAVLLGFQYWKLPVTATIGAGAGVQGIRYKEGEYFNDGRIEFAANIMNEIEFSVTETFRFHSLVRWIFKSERITTFENAVMGYDKKPVGRMGGLYFACGFKYCWR